MTVSGIRCRAGSRCRPHRELGYWYCEVNESNNFNNNWDYCCQPQSRCGYSNGFNYPWCYVGTEASGQWRPCSDRYAERPYAYLHRNLPPNATEPTIRPPFKIDEDVIRPVDSNSADFSRSNSHIIVKTNCTDEEWSSLISRPSSEFLVFLSQIQIGICWVLLYLLLWLWWRKSDCNHRIHSKHIDRTNSIIHF